MNFCPQCGTPFEPGARFCMQCGFDKSSLIITKPAEADTPAIVTETITEEIPAAVVLPPSETIAQSACVRCGQPLNSGSKVCMHCGFETGKEPETVAGFKPVDLPRSIFNQSTEKINLKVPEAKPVNTVSQADKAEISAVPDQGLPQNPVPQTVSPQVVVVRKKTGKRNAFIFIAICLLGLLGWIGYNTWQGSQQDNVTDTFQNMQLPPIDDTSNAANAQPATSEIHAETPTETQQAAKPVSKIDQELAKQKANTKNKNATVAVPTPLPKTTEQNRESDHAQVSEKATTIIFEVGRKEDARSKNPKNPSKFSIQSPTMIVRITTDHYNDGMGTQAAGKISILDRDGNNIGSFKAYGKSGTDGTPNAKWVCEPHKVLEKGTYKIQDSEMSTWSKTFLGTGFVVIEGYEME